MLVLRGGLVRVGTPLIRIRAHGLLGGVFVRTPAEGGVATELVEPVSPGQVPALQSA